MEHGVAPGVWSEADREFKDLRTGMRAEKRHYGNCSVSWELNDGEADRADVSLAFVNNLAICTKDSQTTKVIGARFFWNCLLKF